jgi:hypothetical protein
LVCRSLIPEAGRSMPRHGVCAIYAGRSPRQSVQHNINTRIVVFKRAFVNGVLQSATEAIADHRFGVMSKPLRRSASRA